MGVEKAAATGLRGTLTGLVSGFKSATASAIAFFTVGSGGTVLLVVAALAALAAVAVVVWKNWDRIKQVLKPVTDGFKSLWKQISPFVKVLRQNVVSALKSMASGLLSTIVPGKKFGQQIHSIVKAVGAWIAAMGPKLIKVIAAVSRWVKMNQPLFKTLGHIVGVILVRGFKQFWNTLKLGYTIIRTAIKIIKQFIANIKQQGPATKAVIKAWQALWKAIKTAARGIWNAVKSAWKQVANLTKSAWNGVTKLIGGAWKAIKRAVVGGAKGVWNAVKNAWNQIKKITSSVWKAIGKVLSSFWKNEKRGFTTILKALGKLVSRAWDSIKRTTSKVWDAIKSFFSKWWNALKSLFTSSTNQNKALLSKTWNSIKSTIEKVWNAIKSFFSKWWNALKTLVNKVVNAIKSLLSKAWNAIKSTAIKSWEAIKKAITDRIEQTQKNINKTIDAVKKFLSQAWDDIKSAASKAWEAISKSMWKPIENAYNQIKEWINKIIDLVNAVLKKVGLPAIGASGDGGGGGGGGGSTPHTAGEGGRGSPTGQHATGGLTLKDGTRYGEPLRYFAKGGWSERGTGGMAGPKQPRMHLWGEGSYDEGFITTDPHHRRDNLKYLQVIASKLGRVVIPAQSWSGDMGGNQYNIRRAERYGGIERFESGGLSESQISEMKKRGEEAMGHPYAHGTAAGPGGYSCSGLWNWITTGSHASTGGGTLEYYPGKKGWKPGGGEVEIGVVIHGVPPDGTHMWGDIQGTSYESTVPAGVHHGAKAGGKPSFVPGTPKIWHIGDAGAAASGGGSGGGSSPIPNPLQILFDATWDHLVKPIADKFINPFKNKEYVLLQAVGAMGETMINGIHDWIDEKIPDMIGGGGSGSGDTPSGDSPKGLTISEAVDQGGFSSGQHGNAVGVAWEESGGNAGNNINQYRGLFAMGPDAFNEVGMDYNKWNDPIYNANAAMKLQKKLGWAQPWSAWPVSSDSKGRGNEKVYGYDTGGLVVRDHPALVHANELIMPLDNMSVTRQVQQAMGTGEINKELRHLRRDINNLTVELGDGTIRKQAHTNVETVKGYVASTDGANAVARAGNAVASVGRLTGKKGR
jgi:phage-related protein